MACAVETMAPHLAQQLPEQRGEHCGAASVQAAKDPEGAPEQVGRVRSAVVWGIGSVVCILSSGDWLEGQHQSQKSHHLLSPVRRFSDFCLKTAPACPLKGRMASEQHPFSSNGRFRPSQAAERQEGTGSPDTREDAGASSGESNTQKVDPHAEAARYHDRASEAADPSRLAPSGQSGKGETDEKAAGGKDGKPGCKLPRPEGSTACPRCESMDTKFCYYNNYNVKQPRYFCKVGTFHSWTSGIPFISTPGTMPLRLGESVCGGVLLGAKLSCVLKFCPKGVATGQPQGRVPCWHSLPGPVLQRTLLLSGRD